MWVWVYQMLNRPKKRMVFWLTIQMKMTVIMNMNLHFTTVKEYNINIFNIHWNQLLHLDWIRFTGETEVPATGKPPMGLQGTGTRPRVERGGAQSRETAADTGTMRRAQRQAAEAYGWRVRATSRLEALCTSTGGGKRVQIYRVIWWWTTADGWESGWRKENNNP